MDTTVCPCNVLMCVEVLAMIPTSLQALLRCAGTVGVAAYNEVTAQNRAQLWIEKTFEEDLIVAVPCVFPLSSQSRGYTLAVTHDYLVRHNLSFEGFDFGRTTSVRYVVGPFVTTTEHPEGRHRKIVSKKDIKSVTLGGFVNVRSLSCYFLCAFCSIKNIDLYPLRNVRSLGRGFMYECKYILKIDLSVFTNLEKIDDAFLCGCTSLISVIPFPEATAFSSIGTSFMSDCSSLRTVDLRSLRNITHIPSSFLSSCSSLTSIDLSPLSNVAHIDASFLHCTYIPTIDLSPLTKVISIGDYFVSGCPSIRNVDASSLSNVISVGNNFFHDFVTFKQISTEGFGDEMKAILESKYSRQMPLV